MSWHGSVLASGFLFDEALLARDELVRRVLATWTDGARLARDGGRWYLVNLTPRRVDSRLVIGAPLVFVSGRWLQTPIEEQALAKLAADSVTELRAGERVTRPWSELEAVDPSTLIDLPLPRVASVRTLEPPPVVVDHPRPASPAAPSLQGVFATMLAGHGIEGPPPTTMPEPPPPPSFLARLGQSVRAFFRGPTRPRLPPGRPAPLRPTLLQRLAGSLRPLLEAAQSKQRRYLDDLRAQFAQGNLDEALRRAIPLGRPGAGPQGPQALGVPTRRDHLTLLQAPRTTAPSMRLEDDEYEQLRKVYRAAFEQLLSEGKIDEAAYVLAHLLQDPNAAVALLEKHQRYELAAKLAGLQQLAPAEQIRLWLLAKQPAEAVAIARRTNTFAEAVAMLEQRQPSLAALLRLAWGDTLARRGRYADAIEATAPLPHASQMGDWVERALEAGGASAAIALAVDLRRTIRGAPLEATALAQRRLDELLRRDPDASVAQTSARALLRHAQYAGPTVYRGLWRQLMAGAGGGRQVDPGLVEKVLNAANDPVLRADSVAPTKWTPQNAQTEREPFVPTPGEVGTLPIADVAELPRGRRVVALGAAGLRVLGADGALVRHLIIKADALVAGPLGVPVLVVSRDGALTRVSRLDPYSFALTSWFQSSALGHFARTYDGLCWAVGQEDSLVFLDTHDSAPTEWWRVPDFRPTRLEAAGALVWACGLTEANASARTCAWLCQLASQKLAPLEAELHYSAVATGLRSWRLEHLEDGRVRLAEVCDVSAEGRSTALSALTRAPPLPPGAWKLLASELCLVGVRVARVSTEVWLLDWQGRSAQLVMQLPATRLATARLLGDHVVAVADEHGRLFELDLATQIVSERARV